MTYVPNHRDYDEQPWSEDRPSITVYPLRENRRPIGFAPWPKEKKAKKRKKSRK